MTNLTTSFKYILIIKLYSGNHGMQNRKTKLMISNMAHNGQHIFIVCTDYWILKS